MLITVAQIQPYDKSANSSCTRKICDNKARVIDNKPGSTYI